MKGTMAAAGAVGLGVILWALLDSSEERQTAVSPAPTANERVVTREPLVPGGELETGESAAPARRVAATRARGVEITIRVVFEEDGTPAPDVGVYLRPMGAGTSGLGLELRTDQSGTAHLDELARGTYSIDLDRWGREPLGVELTSGRTVELAIPDGIDVSGVVVDTQGNGVPGAEVFRLNDGHHDFLQWVATTDPTGSFRLRDVAPSTAFVARAEGFQPSSPGRKGTRPEIVPSQGSRHGEVRLVLGAAGHSVSGRVLDEYGNPAPQARIVFAVEEDTREEGKSNYERYRENGKPADLEAFSIRAARNGFFQTRQVPAGSVTWFAQSVDPTYVAVGTLEVLSGVKNPLEIVLGPGAGVTGVLTDEVGEPVGDYLIEHEWRGSLALGQLEHHFGMQLANRSTVTGADGSFELLGLLPGETGLDVRHPSGLSLGRERIELEPGELFRWAPRIERSKDLTLRLVGPTGEPLVGWGVGLCSRPSTLRALRPGQEEGFVPEATDADGRYTYRDVRAREWIVTAHPPGDGSLLGIPPPSAVREGVYPGGGDILLSVAALPTGSVRGRVLDSAGGVPTRKRRGEASPAEVGLLSGEFDRCGVQPLGRNGAFEIGALPQGVYAVVLRGADGYPRDLVLAEFELGPGQSLDLGILTPVEPAGVEIDLVAEDGGLIEDPELTLAPVDGDLWVGHRLSRERGDAQGPFRSGALVPGAYTLVVHGGDHQDIAPHSARFELEPGESLRKRITVKRGKEQTFELTLPPHPNEKKPLFESPSARIDIELYRDVDSYLFRLRDRFELFDPSGNRLRLSLRLAPGTYRVVFEDHRDPALRRPRPSSEVEFDVPASGEPEVLLVELD